MRTIRTTLYRRNKESSEFAIANKVPHYLDQGATNKWMGDMEAKELLCKELKKLKEENKIQCDMIKNIEAYHGCKNVE